MSSSKIAILQEFIEKIQETSKKEQEVFISQEQLEKKPRFFKNRRADFFMIIDESGLPISSAGELPSGFDLSLASGFFVALTTFSSEVFSINNDMEYMISCDSSIIFLRFKTYHFIAVIRNSNRTVLKRIRKKIEKFAYQFHINYEGSFNENVVFTIDENELEPFLRKFSFVKGY